jgi:ankyrin repeat protein
MLGRTHWIRQLLKWGVAVDMVDEYGNSGLHYAVAGNHVDATKLLLDEGANPDLSTNDGLTPKQLAKNSESKAIKACFS